MNRGNRKVNGRREGRKNYISLFEFTQKTKGKLKEANRTESDFTHIGSSRSFRAFCNFKLNPVAFVQGLKAFGNNCRVVSENILATILLNKTKSFGLIKPLYCAF